MARVDWTQLPKITAREPLASPAVLLTELGKYHFGRDADGTTGAHIRHSALDLDTPCRRHFLFALFFESIQQEISQVRPLLGGQFGTLRFQLLESNHARTLTFPRPA